MARIRGNTCAPLYGQGSGRNSGSAPVSLSPCGQAAVLHAQSDGAQLESLGQGQNDGIGAHAVVAGKVLGHVEDHHAELFLRPGHIGAPVGHLSGGVLHDLGVAAENGDLPGVGIQHRAAGEERMGMWQSKMY